MVNKSSKCTRTYCQMNTIKPIYYRDDDRNFRVAFYVCTNCMDFSGFINAETGRKMPYVYKMQGFVDVRLVKNIKDNKEDLESRKNKVLAIQKDYSLPCFVCERYQYSRLYFRERSVKEKYTSFHYVGYICKWCKTAYFVNRSWLKLRTSFPKGIKKTAKTYHGIPINEYVGTYATTTESVKEKYTSLAMKIRTNHLSKLRRAIKKQKIDVKYSSDLELTPLKFSS